MTVMSAKEVREGAKDDGVLMTAYYETNDWHPGAILTIIVPVLLVVVFCALVSWLYNYVGLPDLETIRATAEALR